jgi:hypothetical protein
LAGSLPDTVSRLFPTPLAHDGTSNGTSAPNRSGGASLTDTVTVLLPTPACSNPNDGEDTSHWLARQTRHQQRGINGNGMGMPLSIAVRLLPTPRASDTGTPGRKASQGFRPPLSEQVLPLFPTPRATEGTKGSPNQHGSKGDLTLSSTVVRLLPTPRAGINRNSRKALKVHRSGPGLEQAIEITLGILPTELSNWDEAPAAWTAAQTAA